jgi:hypothetical protein
MTFTEVKDNILKVKGLHGMTVNEMLYVTGPNALCGRIIYILHTS